MSSSNLEKVIAPLAPTSLNTLWQLIREVKDPLSHEVTRKRLIEDIGRMNYGGKTPKQTLSRQLQDLRDAGKNEFTSRGVYRAIDVDEEKVDTETNVTMVEVHPQLMTELTKEIYILSRLSGYGTLPEIQRRLSLIHKMMCVI
jgi:hypothetical protein